MGRLSKFISKAGDIVQQVSDEIQKPQQQQQGYQQAPGQPQGYPQQHSQQYFPQQTQFQPPAPQTQQPYQAQGHFPQQYQSPSQYSPNQVHASHQPTSTPPHQASQVSQVQYAPTGQYNYETQRAGPSYSSLASVTMQRNNQNATLPSGLRPTTECVDNPVTFALDWFVHGAAPGFTVCSRCYSDYILNSAFRGVFSQTHLPAGKARQCLFSRPRVKEFLWPEAVASSSLDGLVTYMRTRSELPACPEANPQTGQNWHIALENPDLGFCPGCYEDYIRSGPFESCFRLETREEARICHHAVWSYRRMLETYSKSRNWRAFISESSQRLQVVACPKTELVTGPGRNWFVSPRGPDGFQVCEACYWDYFRGSRDGASFHAKQLGTQEQAICLMSQINFLIPVMRAHEMKNLDIFWQAARGISENPLCTAKGITGARWYTLPNSPAEFDVCGACLAGIVAPLGLEHHFQLKTSVGPTDTLLCCFNIQGFWRAFLYLEKLMEGFYIDSWKPLGELATRLAHAPACPKINRQEAARNRRWWGWNDAHICEECYSISIRGSSLEPAFELRDQDIAEPRICDLFSGRMRNRYHTACENNDLTGFLQFARQRRQTYLQTMPECDRLLSQAKFALSQAQTLGLAAVTFSAAGNLTDSTWGHSYTVGNSVVGHGYANEQLMNAAMADHQMQMTGAAATGPAAIARVGMLEKMWKMVE